MAIYKLEKKYGNEGCVKIEVYDKHLFTRIELAIDHVYKEFEEKKKKEALRNECV